MTQEVKDVGGRPPKFTAQRCRDILESIASRIPYKYAAEGNGIREETLYAWINRGREEDNREEDTELARFYKALKKIEHDTMQKHLANISENPKNWQAQAWILERRWWKEFSPSTAVLDFESRLAKMEEDSNAKGNDRK